MKATLLRCDIWNATKQTLCRQVAVAVCAGMLTGTGAGGVATAHLVRAIGRVAVVGVAVGVSFSGATPCLIVYVFNTEMDAGLFAEALGSLA